MSTRYLYPDFCVTDADKAEHIAFTATVRSLDFDEQQEAARLLYALLKPCPKCGHDESVTECPRCGTPRSSNNYCIRCGHIYHKAGGY